jgi:hypothetical protein
MNSNDPNNHFITGVTIALTALFIFVALTILAPNPFGNNPDIIGDESYFLTSSLSAIQKFTPPGLIFERAGNYYGGPQTYLDTVVLIPVVGGIVAVNHFSLQKAETSIALHTGDLLSILRFVNSLCVVIFCGFFFMLFVKRKIPRPLALQFLLLLFLIFSNSLVAGFVHTAKVWTIYLLMDVGVGVLFIANEYYLSHRQEPFIKKNLYIGLIVWAGVIAFFQNYVGVFPIALWAFYALLLKHIDFRDIWKYVLRWWYLIVGFTILNLSFIYRAAFVKDRVSWWDPGVVSATVNNTGTTVDWFHRLYNPIAFAIESQPLLFLYVIGLIGALVFLFKTRSSVTNSRKRLYLIIACIHPVLIYLIFHLILGFSLFPRYSLTLTAAGTMAIVMFAGESKLFLKTGLILSALLFLVVGVHSIQLYWQPSSDVILTQTLEKSFNSPSNVFIIEPSAWRLSLPLNATSLSLLNARHQSMIRYTFLLSHLSSVNPVVSFKPTVVIADTDPQTVAYISQLETASSSVWTITADCTDLCTVAETQAGTCFMLNLHACGNVPQEINTLPDFLSFTQMGTSYVVRKIH